MNQNREFNNRIMKPNAGAHSSLLVLIMIVVLGLAGSIGYRLGVKKGAQDVQTQWNQAELDRAMCPCDTLDYTGREYWNSQETEAPAPAPKKEIMTAKKVKPASEPAATTPEDNKTVETTAPEEEPNHD